MEKTLKIGIIGTGAQRKLGRFKSDFSLTTNVAVKHQRRPGTICLRCEMAIVINLDVMLAKRKVKPKDLAEFIGITEQNLSLIKTEKVKGFRRNTKAPVSDARHYIFSLFTPPVPIGIAIHRSILDLFSIHPDNCRMR